MEMLREARESDVRSNDYLRKANKKLEKDNEALERSNQELGRLVN